MRLLIIAPLALLAACDVDQGNDAVTVSYNEAQAEEAVDDVANAAQEAGQAIANGTEEAVETARNVDVDVDVDANTADNRN